jgi:alpha-galactosidase
MNITSQFDIDILFIGLKGLQPVLNSEPIEGCSIEYRENQAIFTKDTIVFTVELTHEPHWFHYIICYSVEGLPTDYVLDSFGIRFSELTNVHAFLRMGYYSWDSSYYVELEKAEAQVIQGYAVTQLLNHLDASVLLGFDRHDRFQQTFTLDTTNVPYSLTIETWWDRKDRKDLSWCKSENLWITVSPLRLLEPLELLHKWSREIVSKAMNPRLSAPPIRGWCSWYNLYAAITEENILEHLRGVKEVKERENLPMSVFQIDDGFTPEMGDWLDIKPQFPRGMKPLLDDIREAGFTPGLWIAPFMVGNRSKLYQEHPDWVVVDRETGKPLPLMRFYGEFRWHKRSEEYYTLDTTHPDAFEYLRNVFRVWRNEWGCEYFKTDFMHFGTEHTPANAKWHQDGMTRIELWRRTCEMIRKEIGDAVWLGCGCPLWASIGLVDGIRIGGDVGVEWQDGAKAHGLLRNQMLRNFGNGILWQADPDCILLRERFHNLSHTEIQSLAIFAGMAGGVLMTSDALHELSDEHLSLWKLVLNRATHTACEYPSLGSMVRNLSDPVIVQHRGLTEMSAIFFLNTGDMPVQRTYRMYQFMTPRFEETLHSSDRYTYDWTTDTTTPEKMSQIDLVLQPHEGRLLFLSKEPFTEPPQHLP